MRLTIIRADNMVYVDGLALKVDCSSLPSSFHALQWYDTQGEIEWIDPTKPSHYPTGNEAITTIASYQSFIDAHTEAKNAAPPTATSSSTGSAGVIIK